MSSIPSLATVLLSPFVFLAPLLAAPATQPADQKMIGMYIHQHWPYKHPYAARTWTYDDWCGYVGGLKKLGYNTIVIWPMLDTMPEPPTPSDREHLEKLGRVIDAIHNEMNMRVYIVLAPNVIAEDAVAGQSTFQDRHFYHCDSHVNPADDDGMNRMMHRRERQMKPLAAADGVLIIDSDPGGYPDSTNQEFIQLMQRHREMLDRLRPGIELVYWVWSSWPAWNRMYTSEKPAPATPEEYLEALRLFKDLNPEPWGLAHGLEYAQKLGIESRDIALQYGAIEGEPSFPLTNFGGDAAWKGGSGMGPRGVIGNAQTHCVQLPNTFAFVRGAQGRPVAEPDYLKFANDLIAGAGEPILNGWKAMAGGDVATMRSAAERLEELAKGKLTPGELEGLLFGDPQRFVLDLACQLRYGAAAIDLDNAAATGQNLREPLRAYVAALDTWYGRHGYQNGWAVPKAVAELDSPEVRAVFNFPIMASGTYGRVRDSFYGNEVFTPRLVKALHRTLARLDAQAATQPAPAADFRFKTRGIYFHDGFTLEQKKLAPLHWDEEQWRREIDWLHACGIDTVEFAIQAEFCRKPKTKPEKRKIEDRLKVLHHAHSLGMRFGYILSNTIVSTVPENEPPGDQRGGRFKELCPREPGNFEKTLALQKWLMNTYREADFFEEFAADYGGCGCGKCGVEDYLRYVRALSEELSRLNPKARLYADTWCIAYWGPNLLPQGWRAVWDREITGSREVIAALPDLPANVQLALPCHHLYRPLVFKSYGGRAATPVFPELTDIERVHKASRETLAWTHFIVDDDTSRAPSWGVVHSEVRYIRDLLRHLRAAGIDNVMCNLYLPLHQLSNTYAYGRLLDNPDDDPVGILRGFSRLVAHPDDIEKLLEVMIWLENHSYWEQQMPAGDRLPQLPCRLTGEQALQQAAAIRPNPSPGMPLPIAPADWLKVLKASIERTVKR